MSKRTLQKAFNKFDQIKKKKELEVPGVLGFTINGRNVVEVANRRGYVWVRIRNNFNEVIKAYNDVVSPVFGLPVILIRDEVDRTRYKVKGKDLGAYQDWNGTPYLPRHGNQHSFNPDASGGGDVVFIYNRQFIPLSVQPSGTNGAGSVLIQPYVYYQNGVWKYAGGTGTASLLPYKPTGSASGKMVLVYIDGYGTPGLLPGTEEFPENYTGTITVLPYIPSPASADDIPLAAVRLVSGTNVILWDNIYDLRPIIVSDGFIPTGSTAHIIQDDGAPLAQRTSLNFVGSSFSVYNTAGATNVSGTFVGGSVGIPERSIPIFEDGVFKVTGTIINFTGGFDVIVSGSVAHIYATGTGGGGGAPTDAEYIVSAENGSLSAEVTIPGLAGHSDRKSSGVTGSVSEEYDTTTTGLTWTASTPSVVDSDTKLPSHLYVKSVDSTERLGLMTFNAGYSGTFDARCKMTMMIDSITNDPFFGLIITDSGRNFRMTVGITSAVASQQRYVAAYRFTGTSYTAVGSVWPYNQSEVYLRITRTAANLVSWYWSSDGIGWQLIGTYNSVFNTERIGFRSVSNPHEAFVDWLRAQP